jgi:hypothetical protein
MFCSNRIQGFLLLVFLAAAAITAVGQTTAADRKFFPYKGVSVGMSTEAARKALGAPKDKSEAMDLYQFSDNETVQIFYGANAVTALAITYTGNLKAAPTPTDVFGEDAPPRPDGGIYKMVRYPKAGFWVSYSRTVGDDAIVSIAMQKMAIQP